jgi:hypothetical protein
MSLATSAPLRHVLAGARTLRAFAAHVALTALALLAAVGATLTAGAGGAPPPAAPDRRPDGVARLGAQVAQAAPGGDGAGGAGGEALGRDRVPSRGGRAPAPHALQ